MEVRRLADANLLTSITKTKYRTLGDRAFAIAPTLWISLPLAIQNSDALCSFKSQLKTYLFRTTYNI
jgi:hypothetical protein